jgi:hypothetical protein
LSKYTFTVECFIVAGFIIAILSTDRFVFSRVNPLMGNPRNKRKRHPKPHVIPSLQASGQFTPKFPDSSSPEIISLYQAMVNQAEQRGDEERKRDQDARDKIQKDQSEKLMYRVTRFGVIVTAIVGLAGFWAAWEAHYARIEAHEMGDASFKLQASVASQDQRPFIAVDVETDTVAKAKFGSTENENLLYVDVASFGKSPALHVHGECVVFHKPLSDRPTFISTGKSFEDTCRVRNCLS